MPTYGRFIVPDEYEGTEEDPTSLNRYLYADADPVNNIDPDGHAPKWLQKGWKATKKYSKKGYNAYIGNDIKKIKNPKSKWYQKAGATVSVASNFVPGAGQAKWAAKGAVSAVKYGKKAKKVKKFKAAPLKKERKDKGKPKSGSTDKGLAGRGYKPKAGERTFDGYVAKNVSKNNETKLFTKSKKFNTSKMNADGQFKRFGSGSHGGLSPHVHQPTRNVAKNGEIYGGQGAKTRNGGVTKPGKRDVKQLYQYLKNKKYRK
jgi:hypothetical protein